MVAAWIRRASSCPKRRRASLWNGAVPAITKPPFRPLAPDPAVRPSSTVADDPVLGQMPGRRDAADARADHADVDVEVNLERAASVVAVVLPERRPRGHRREGT